MGSRAIKEQIHLKMLAGQLTHQIKKIKIPVLVVHGSKDNNVSLDHSWLVYKLLDQPKKLIIIKGSPHTWRKPKYYKKINPIVTDWFKKYL